ncbi:MAG: hypothetical protein IPG11_13965 [Flavobacteriales bacterium]|nr:hypothetical protein [Flavobacteriales bacterium]
MNDASFNGWGASLSISINGAPTAYTDAMGGNPDDRDTPVTSGDVITLNLRAGFRRMGRLLLVAG